MKIFLITDIHYWEDINYPQHRDDIDWPYQFNNDYINSFWDALIQNKNSIYKETELCDLVINLGDLISNKNSEIDIQKYIEAVSILSYNKPLKHVLGNHDAYNISREMWSNTIKETKCYYDFDLFWYHHIVLDWNNNELKGPGIISDEQRIWLIENLEKTDLPTIIYIHHPIDEQARDESYYFINRPQNASVNNRSEIRNVLEKSGKVCAVFSWHTHFFSEQKIWNINYITIPSFSENNWNHKPNLKYWIAEIDDKNIQISIKDFYNN